MIERIPLISSSNKITKIIGYVLYGFIFLILLGAILPAPAMTAEDYYNNGCDLIVDGKYEEAITSLDEALKLDPNYANAWHEKAVAFYMTDRYNQALDCYDEALKLDPKAETWSDKADIYFELKKHDERIKCYDEALKLDPRSADLWNAKGITFQDGLGNPEEALKCYEKAIENDPENSIAWLNKAGALQTLGRLEEAKEAQAKGDELWDAEKL